MLYGQITLLSYILITIPLNRKHLIQPVVANYDIKILLDLSSFVSTRG